MSWLKRITDWLLYLLFGGATTLSLFYTVRAQARSFSVNPPQLWSKDPMNPVLLPFGFLLDASFSALTGGATPTPAPVDTIKWTISDPTLAELIPVKDNAAAISVRPLASGKVQLRLEVDVRLGPGVKTLTAVGEIEIPAEAVTLGIVFGGLREDVPTPAVAV